MLPPWRRVRGWSPAFRPAVRLCIVRLSAGGIFPPLVPALSCSSLPRLLSCRYCEHIALGRLKSHIVKPWAELRGLVLGRGENLFKWHGQPKRKFFLENGCFFGFLLRYVVPLPSEQERQQVYRYRYIEHFRPPL